jgi:hypothetical protein
MISRDEVRLVRRLRQSHHVINDEFADKVTTGSSARTSRNASEAAINCGLVRQTITAKGRRFLSAPTRSLRDALDAVKVLCDVRSKESLKVWSAFLCCRGIQVFLIFVDGT